MNKGKEERKKSEKGRKDKRGRRHCLVREKQGNKLHTMSSGQSIFFCCPNCRGYLQYSHLAEKWFTSSEEVKVIIPSHKYQDGSTSWTPHGKGFTGNGCVWRRTDASPTHSIFYDYLIMQVNGGHVKFTARLHALYAWAFQNTIPRDGHLCEFHVLKSTLSSISLLLWSLKSCRIS